MEEKITLKIVRGDTFQFISTALSKEDRGARIPVRFEVIVPEDQLEKLHLKYDFPPMWGKVSIQTIINVLGRIDGGKIELNIEGFFWPEGGSRKTGHPFKMYFRTDNHSGTITF